MSVPSIDSEYENVVTKIRGSIDSKSQKKRVCFQEDVAVRYISPTDSIDQSVDSLASDDEKFDPPFFHHTGYQPKDDSTTANSTSFDIFYQDISSKSSEIPIAVSTYSASSSKNCRSRDSPNFEDCFAEMNSRMKQLYPHYYEFLQAHMITAKSGTEIFKLQETDFKEAIVNCDQYPTEYFEDLESTLKVYKKLHLTK